MTDPQPAGADLARIALQQARAAAKGRPSRPVKPVKRRTMRRTDGRDPMPLGAAIERLVTEHGWETPAAGGTVIDQWADIAPELAGKVSAEGFDAETGCLSLRPVNQVYGTQLRLLQQAMVNRINSKLGRAAVRSLRVLPPGVPARDAVGGRDDGGGAPLPTAAPGTVGGPALRTRADASPGLLAAQEVVEAARDRVPRTIGGRSELADAPVLREPESAFTDAVALMESLTAQAVRDDDPRARALARARAEKAGRAVPVPRAFEQTA